MIRILVAAMVLAGSTAPAVAEILTIEASRDTTLIEQPDGMTGIGAGPVLPDYPCPVYGYDDREVLQTEAWKTWSYALCKKVEYMAVTGTKPSLARPAAKVSACCSAMPTSKNLS